MKYSFKDKDNRTFVLTSERWNHIIERHPEMEEHLLDLETVLMEPDIICRSTHVHNTILYYKKFGKLSLKRVNFSDVYITVIVDISKNLIKTAYPAREIIKGEKIWQKIAAD